jgi:release factor glutamine methyltransferase
MDILKQIPDYKFDIIVSNPPYIAENEIKELQPEVSLFEPLIALNGGNDGLMFYKRFFQILPSILCDDGNFFFEFGLNQHENIKKIFSESFDIVIDKDFNGLQRFISGNFI